MTNRLPLSLAASQPQQDNQPAPLHDDEPGEVCLPNISPRERRRRLIAGMVQFAVAFAVLAALVTLGVDRWWRLLLLPLFWGAASGVFQWRDKT